jgi:hypothetical protein
VPLRTIAGIPPEWSEFRLSGGIPAEFHENFFFGNSGFFPDF